MLDPQVSPEEITSRKVEMGLKIGLLLHQLFLNRGATDIVLVILLSTAMVDLAELIAPGAAWWRWG